MDGYDDEKKKRETIKGKEIFILYI